MDTTDAAHIPYIRRMIVGEVHTCSSKIQTAECGVISLFFCN